MPFSTQVGCRGGVEAEDNTYSSALLDRVGERVEGVMSSVRWSRFLHCFTIERVKDVS